jgi:hypothetical protein
MRALCLVSVFIAASTYSAFGQVRSEYFRSLFIDLEGNAGHMNQQIKTIPFSTNYEDAIAANTAQGTIKFKDGWSKGFNARIGYYFGKNRTWGIGSGFTYYKQEGVLNLDTFHVEFRSQDYLGQDFRQVISTRKPIKESIVTTSINIPVLIHYKKAFNDNLCLTVDAGILYNLKAQNTFSSDARFDYEAIYKFEGSVPVYDHSAVPDTTSYLITRQGYLDKNPNGNVNTFFKEKDSIGYSVALNQKGIASSTTASYKKGSIGYTLDVAAIYKVWRNIYVRGGVYYAGQNFTNTSSSNSLRLTESKIKDANGKTTGVNYNSLLNQVQSNFVHNYGITLGLRVYINRSAWKYQENDMNKVTPASGHGN